MYADALPLAVVDLERIRANVAGIAARTGVDVLAVVKADGYGCGLLPVARAVKDLVAGFYVFRPSEAIETNLWRETARPTVCALSDDHPPEELIAHHVRPAVWDVATAARLRPADPLLAVDTGQQRFACPEEQLDAVAAAGDCREAFTHASTPQQVERFDRLTAARGWRRHAAGTALLDLPEARFDAVRPGLAMYKGALRVTTRLLDARDSRGPAGYGGFQTPRHGVIIGGYSNGLSAGVCLVNGTRRRLLEVGMQSAFVELGPADKPGDEVVLLGDDLAEQDVANAWRCSPQEAIYRLARCGRKQYAGGA